MPVLVLLLVLAAEAFGIYLVGEWLRDHFLAIFLAIGISFVGFSLINRLKAGLDPKLLQQTLLVGGMPALAETVLVPMVGAVLIAIPGFLSTLVGLTLLAKPTRRLWTKLVMKLGAKALEAQMKRGGSGPGFPFGPGPTGPAPSPDAIEQLLRQMRGGSPPSIGGGHSRGRERVRDAEFEVKDD